MSATAGRAAVAPAEFPVTAGKPAPALDAFPRTRRPLPWFLAGFLALLFLVPIDSTQVKIHLPVDSHIDRFALVVLVFAWLWFGGDQRAFMRTRRSKLFVGATCIFLTLAVASLVLDSGRVINLDQFTPAPKHFALLMAFMAIGWYALTALRYEDLQGLATWLIVLGTAMAIGMLVERRSGTNYFYNLTATFLKPIATVAPAPTDIHPVFGSDGRVTVVGPTLHGLAAATMLVMVMPFCLLRVLHAPNRGVWLRNAAAFGLMVGGAMATDKKTAFVVPVAIVLYVALYRPRQVLRLAPLGIIVFGVLVHVAAPGAIGKILDIQRNVTSNSTAHRLGDYSGIAADVNAHLVLGRGFGTTNVAHPDQFRINDDQYLGVLWEVGLLGLAAYVWLILSPVATAWRAIRARGPTVPALALASSAGCVAYLVANALFDTLSFPQTPYLFFVVAAMTVIASAGPDGNVEPALGVRRLVATPRALQAT